MRPIDVEVDLCDTGGEYFLQPRLNVSLPSVECQLGKLVEVGQFGFNGTRFFAVRASSLSSSDHSSAVSSRASYSSSSSSSKVRAGSESFSFAETV